MMIEHQQRSISRGSRIDQTLGNLCIKLSKMKHRLAEPFPHVVEDDPSSSTMRVKGNFIACLKVDLIKILGPVPRSRGICFASYILNLCGAEIFLFHSYCVDSMLSYRLFVICSQTTHV